MFKNLKILFLIITLTIFSSSLFAEKVNKIVIDGNSRVSDETVKTY